MTGAEYNFDALGTHWWIELIGRKVFPDSLKASISARVTEFEADYSRFKSDSLIGQLNDEKLLVAPSDELIALFEFAQKMNKQTSGLFNISVGGKLENLGYGREADNNAHISEELDSDIHVSKKEVRIADHIRVDFGGFGKGWLVDELSNLINKAGYPSHIVNGGGDIHVEAPSPQLIYVEHPTNMALAIGEISIKKGGLAASSANRRRWTDKTGEHHHIIDPQSDKSHSALSSVHIAAGSTLLADSLATVFLLVDDEERKKLAKQFAVEYLSIYYDLSFYMSPAFPCRMY